VGRLDEVRNQLGRALKMDPELNWISISFTQDKEWV